MNDLRNTKIVPCETHRLEFGCKTFLSIFTEDPKVTKTESPAEDYDLFRFALTELDASQRLINFQVRLMCV